MSRPALLTKDEREELRLIILQLTTDAESVVTRDHPGWEDEVYGLARKLAIGKLGIEKEIIRLERLRVEIQKLSEEADALEDLIQEKLPLDRETKRHHGSCRTKKSLCDALEDLTEEFKDSAMSRHKIGAKVLDIRKHGAELRTKLAGCSTRADVNEKGCLVW